MHLSLTIKCCHAGYVDIHRFHTFYTLGCVHEITNNVHLQLTLQKSAHIIISVSIVHVIYNVTARWISRYSEKAIKRWQCVGDKWTTFHCKYVQCTTYCVLGGYCKVSNFRARIVLRTWCRWWWCAACWLKCTCARSVCALCYQECNISLTQRRCFTIGTNGIKCVELYRWCSKHKRGMIW